MTPEQKFQHSVRVRNRTIGEGATKVSPHLNVEVTEDNKRFLQIKSHDLNMYRVLQQSTCRHGARRKVARRALTALGGVSGVCGVVNGVDQLKSIKAGLQFTDSLEHIKFAEKEMKEAARAIKSRKKKAAALLKAEKAEQLKVKRKSVYAALQDKLGLRKEDKVMAIHVAKLTKTQLQAVAFVQCDGGNLKGKVDEMRSGLN